MIKIPAFLFLLFLSAPTLHSAREPSESPPRPNIVLILVDDMGWSDIGCFGGEIHTPNLDRLGMEGVRFTQFHNTSKCFPSRASLLTGLYAQQVGFGRTHHSHFRNSATLGEVLKTAGYRTYASGKHHSIENLYDRGFDHYYGLRDGAANHFNPGYRRPGEPAPATKKGHERWWAFDDREIQGWTPDDPDYYSTDRFTDWALGFLQDHFDQDPEAPFFLFLSYQAPHDPLQAWPEDIAKYEGKYDHGYEKIRQARYEKQRRIGLIDDTFGFSAGQHRDWDSLTPEERETEARLMEVYAAMMDRVDQNLGRMLDFLNSRGVLENTLVLFTSDNGGSAEVVDIPGDEGQEIGSMGHWASLGEDWANVTNTPFRHFKNDSYQGGICAPLIAWWPRELGKPGRTVSYAGHFIDIMPTLIEITGATYPEQINDEPVLPLEGVSLLSLLQGGEAPLRDDPLFWHWRDGGAIRDDTWKMVFDGSQENWELYRIVDDKSELSDVKDQHPRVALELRQQFDRWFARWGSR